MLHIFGTVIKKKKVIILGIIYILLLILVILAGKAKKMKLQEQVSQSDSRPITTEQVSVFHRENQSILRQLFFL